MRSCGTASTGFALRLENERRTILVPTTVRVDTKAPVASLLRVRPDAFSPDGDGRADQVKVLYRSNEEGRPELLVDGISALVARNRARGQASVNWNGKLDGELVGVGYLQPFDRRSRPGRQRVRADDGTAGPRALSRARTAIPTRSPPGEHSDLRGLDRCDADRVVADVGQQRAPRSADALRHGRGRRQRSRGDPAFDTSRALCAPGNGATGTLTGPL